MALQKVGEKALQAGSTLAEVASNQKPKKAVLEEDQYVEDLEKIIVRDFYPDLTKLQIQKEYLLALETNDREKLREIHLKYGPKRNVLPGKTPDIYSTPSTFETPIDKPRNTPKPPDNTGSGTSKEPSSTGDEPIDLELQGPTHNPELKDLKQPADLSLNKYLSKYTSEDNASFGEIMEEAERKHRIKHAWLYEQEQEKSQELENQLALPGIEQQAIESGNSTKVLTWKYKAKNSIMYVPEGVEHSSKEIIQAKGKQEQAIEHSNTRFVTAPFNTKKSAQSIAEAANTQAALLHGKVGVDGKEMLPTTTPRVNGYGFVATPSPAPGVEDSPLMTWGEIEGTPFRLDGGDTPIVANRTPGPQFKIPQVPNRDRIALQLAENASKAHRDKKQQAMQRVRSNFATPSPKFGNASKTDRLGYLSPAAQRLASSKLGIRTNTDKALRASYTPSPVHSIRGVKTPMSSGKTPTPGSSSRRSQLGTPKSGANTPSSTRSTADKRLSTSLTDNLLNLPKRQKAQDFF